MLLANPTAPASINASANFSEAGIKCESNRRDDQFSASTSRKLPHEPKPGFLCILAPHRHGSAPICSNVQ
jgi:hypothetical protein